MAAAFLNTLVRHSDIQRKKDIDGFLALCLTSQEAT